MIEPKKPSNETERLNDLIQHQILDTEGEEDFNMLVELASRICGTPVSILTLIDEDRQWFKAKHGIEDSQTPRKISFCGHAILQNDLFVVNDATKDERFHDNPLVVEDPSIRFYAGAQIVSSNGYKLGTLCVIDDKPRELNWHQASALKVLSRQASRLLELRMLKRAINKDLPSQDWVNKQQQLLDWVALQAAYYADAKEPLFEPLKTGKFTKKELARIYDLSNAMLSANKRFHQILDLYKKLSSSQLVKEFNDFFPVEVLNSKIAVLAEKWKKKKLAFSFNDTNAKAAISHPVETTLALEQLIETLVRELADEIEVEVFSKKESIEFRFHFSRIAITENSGVIHLNKEEDPIKNQGRFILQLLKWLFVESGHVFEIETGRNEGSTVVLLFKNASIHLN